MDEQFLVHHGILGMNWGERHGPPYPLDKNPSRQAALKRNSISDYPGGPAKKAKSGPRHKGKEYDSRADIIAARKARQEAKAAKRAAKEEERNRKYEAEKEETLRSGSAKDVLKYQGKLSNNELNNALNRIKMENELRGLADQAKKGKKLVNKVISFVGKYGDTMGKVNKAITQTKAFFKNFEKKDEPQQKKPEVKPNTNQQVDSDPSITIINNTLSKPESNVGGKNNAITTSDYNQFKGRTSRPKDYDVIDFINGDSSINNDVAKSDYDQFKGRTSRSKDYDVIDFSDKQRTINDIEYQMNLEGRHLRPETSSKYVDTGEKIVNYFLDSVDNEEFIWRG